MNPEENAEKNTFVAHYLNEWSMWMDTHPEGLKRMTEINNADKNSADDAGESPIGPHVVVIGASHAGVSFADRLRKNGFLGSISIFDKQVGGPMAVSYTHLTLPTKRIV